MRKLATLVNFQNGLQRNVMRRAFIAQDEPWWSQSSSPWKLTIEHPYAQADQFQPDYWLDEVLELLEHDATHQNFGLSFNDLIEMDPATFEKVKGRIVEYERKNFEGQAPLKNMLKDIK